MGNKLSTEEKYRGTTNNNLNIEIFFVKYNSEEDLYSTLRITNDNFDKYYNRYLKTHLDSTSNNNKDTFIIFNKITNTFNIIGDYTEDGQLINKKYIERILEYKVEHVLHV